ncbi:phosphotransferase [Modestobacter sp. DSM 44400]|uniref:phosphotransferase n=1 Tax=Modestobacter sp. DSM 44400 TaxID=1550230 RepID=UPI001C318A83
MRTVGDEERLTVAGSGTQPSRAARRGEVVLRDPGPGSAAVLALLHHYAAVGFRGAPRPVGSGWSADGREALQFLPGSSPHPGAWPDDALPALGDLVRRAHEAGAGFQLPAGAQWRPWWGRPARHGRVVIGHCDVGPWNVVAGDDGVPYALLDWEFAGPVDPVLELAHAAWLNAQLVDDDIAEAHGLPSAAVRAGQVRLLLDGYGTPAAERAGFVDLLLEVAVRSARAEAVEQAVTPESTTAVTATGYPVLWAITWRARSAAWMVQHRGLLERALG